MTETEHTASEFNPNLTTRNNPRRASRAANAALENARYAILEKPEEVEQRLTVYLTILEKHHINGVNGSLIALEPDTPQATKAAATDNWLATPAATFHRSQPYAAERGFSPNLTTRNNPRRASRAANAALENARYAILEKPEEVEQRMNVYLTILEKHHINGVNGSLIALEPDTPQAVKAAATDNWLATPAATFHRCQPYAAERGFSDVEEIFHELAQDYTDTIDDFMAGTR